jgi:cyclase
MMHPVSSLSSTHYQVTAVSDRVTALIAADGGASISNSVLIDLGGQLLVWDSGMTPQAAREIRRLATAVYGRDVDLLLNSHYHYDHIWGNQVFADLPIVSSRRTRELIMSSGREEFEWTRAHYGEELASWQQRSTATPAELRQRINYLAYYEAIAEALPALTLTAAGITFEQRLTLYGTQLQAEIDSFADVHSPYDSVLYLPEQQIVCSGDILAVGCHPYMAEGNVEHVLQTLDTLVGWGAQTFIPGHGGVGTLADVDRLRGYSEHLLERAGRGDNESPMPDTYRDWALPDFYAMNLRALTTR